MTDTRDPLEKAVDAGRHTRITLDAIAAERERCAKIADHYTVHHSNPDLRNIGIGIAAAIRNED